MESTISNGFLLLLVGMLTVFLILALVVVSGRLLINITNRMHKETAPASPADTIDSKHVALLSAVVEHVTAGQGSITSIRKS